MSTPPSSSHASDSSAIAPTAVADEGQRSLTRDDVLRLGQAGRPWEFVPLAETALAMMPEDAAARFLLAANYARLGLITPARESLARLLESHGEQGEFLQLHAAIDQLPSDVIVHQTLQSNLKRNLTALAERGVDLWSHYPSFCEALAGFQWHQTLDRNIVHRVIDPVHPAHQQWVLWGDFRGWVDRALGTVQAPMINGQPIGGSERAGIGAGTGQSAITTIGFDPPWHVERLCQQRPRQALGEWAAVHVVEPDLQRALRGLATADGSRWILEDRTFCWFGPGAVERFEEHLSRRREGHMFGPVIPIPGQPISHVHAVTASLQRVHDQLLADTERLRGEMLEIYAGRGRTWWADRFRSARSGVGPPLRALICGCRFSSFVQHAAKDILAALSARGVDARLVIEPDDSSQLSQAAYIRHFVEFQPDFTLAPNYPRMTFSARPGGEVCVPSEMPWITWIQDAMPHLFNESVGRSQGELDFAVGHDHEALFRLHAYPRERYLVTPVLASKAKFSGPPIDPDLQRMYTCEIAFVTNHSQTPEQLRLTLREQSKAAPWLGRVIDDLYTDVAEMCQDLMKSSVNARLMNACRRALQAAGVEPSDHSITQIRNQIASPFADRFLRHQTITWAANVAQRRNWRLHVYGQGWEKHPTFARYAKGSVEHGEALRAAYRCAAVQVQASINWPLHQRVFECVLAGGLPVARMLYDDIEHADAFLSALCSRESGPSYTAIDPGTLLPDRVWCDGANHAKWLAFTAQKQRIGVRHAVDPLWTPEYATSKPTTELEAFLAAPALHLFNDWRESMFMSETDLERLVHQAIEPDQRWRQNMIDGLRRRISPHFTYEAFTDRMLSWLQSSLDAPAAPARAPGHGAMP